MTATFRSAQKDTLGTTMRSDTKPQLSNQLSDSKLADSKLPDEMTFASGGGMPEPKPPQESLLAGIREEIEELELDKEVSVFEDDASDSAEGIVQMFGRQKASGYKLMK